MDFPPRSLPDPAPAYLAQLELPHTGNYNAPAQQMYGLHGVDGVFASTLQAQRSGGLVATMQNHTLHPFHPLLQFGYMQHDAAFAGNNSQSTSASTTAAGPASPMGPPDRRRKRKAETLRADDWEPYKKRILDLHIEQNMPLPEVRQTIENEYGFKAELRQYRSRVSQWGKDKNVKPKEMQAIVRKRQKRKLVETHKGPLVFAVRGSQVEPPKIERWMKRHHVVDSFMYAPSPAASTPSAVGCYTISERGSPATVPVYSPAASVPSPGGVYLTAQSPQMPSPALSVSSLVRVQHSAFAGQSPAFTHRSLPSLQHSFVHDHSNSRSATDVGAQTQYKADEEERLRNRILIAEMAPTSNPLETSDMLYELGIVLIEQGRYRAAEEVIRRVVESHESRSGKGDDDAETLRAWDLLGRVLDRQGLFAKAERLFRRALQGKKNVLAPEDPDTLLSMGALAVVLGKLGRSKEAEEMHRETLALHEKVLGPEHPSTLTSMNNLASVLGKLGRYKEAEEMHRETLALLKKVLGPEHPSTLTSMGALAVVLGKLGRSKEAEEMHRETLALRKKVLGPEHPATLKSIGNLASVLGKLGRYKEAEEMHRETLALRKKVLGPEHPATLISVSNLQSVLERKGRYEEVISL